MLEVCGHADWDVSWDHPLLELERLSWRNTWTAVQGAAAKAITLYQWAVSNDGSATRDARKDYRRLSIINVCRYATFSSWA